MFQAINRLLTLPSFHTRADQQLAEIFRTMLIAIFIPSLLVPPIFGVVNAVTGEAVMTPLALVGGVVLAVTAVILFIVLKNGRLRLAGFALCTILFLVITAKIMTDQGLSDRLLPAYFLVIVIAALILRQRYALVFGGATSLALLLTYLLETSNMLNITPLRPSTLGDWMSYTLLFMLPSFLLQVSTNLLSERSRQIETFNEQLQSLNEALEVRVNERTRALRLSINVSQQMSMILDPDVLVREVVDLIQRTFNYYHVHIYLLDASGSILRMAGGTGPVGEQLLEKNHQLTLNQGLIGRAAREKQTVLIGDVTQDDHWLPNPLLPDTRAETAVPILLGRDLLGVLDVQENTINGLSEDDVGILQAVANQVAVALRNSRLLTAVQQQARQEAIINEINQKVQASNSIDDIIETTLQEIGRIVPLQQAVIRIGERPRPSTSAD